MINEPANSKRQLTPADVISKNDAPCAVPAGSHRAAGSIIARRMGFTKLDEGILQSSVMAEDGNTFKIWITLLAACKNDGIARISPIFISSICHIDISAVNQCLEKLQAPDLNSRSLNDDGRRIERIDGGFRIINYHKYRDYTYSGNKEAIKKRKQRERNINELNNTKGTKKGRVPMSPDISASASVSASEDLKDQKKDPVNKDKLHVKHIIPPGIEMVKEYCEERKNSIDPQAFIDHYETRGWVPKGYNARMKDWQAAIRTWEKHQKDNLKPVERLPRQFEGYGNATAPRIPEYKPDRTPKEDLASPEDVKKIFASINRKIKRVPDDDTI